MRKLKNNFTSSEEDLQKKVNQAATIDLYVTRIIYPQAELVTGYTIFAGVDDMGDILTCTGHAPGISVGEHVRLNGTWQIHYNSYTDSDELQLNFNEIISLEFGNEAHIAEYLDGLKVPGCGKATIKKIIEKHGLQTIKYIEEYSEKFAKEKIFGVSQKVLEDIRDKITEKLTIRNIYCEMLAHGFTEKQSVLISERYSNSDKNPGKKSAREIFETDPYFFALDNSEISFGMIDKIMIKEGKFNSKPDARLAAAIEFRVREICEQGHVFVTWDEIHDDIANLLQNPDVNNIIGSTIGIINTQKNIEKNIIDLYQKKFEFFLPGLKTAEKDIAKNLYRIISNGIKEKPVNASIYLSDNLNLSEKQKQAVTNVFSYPVSIISGGPGTGKSYIAKAIYETALKAGLSCLAAAPTGKAAKRLEEAIFVNKQADEENKPQTIHRLLRADGKGNFMHNEKYKLPVDLLIIDESSMVDVLLAKALLQAIQGKTKIVFMGDVNQLPPVGKGNFFEDLINTIESINFSAEEKEAFPLLANIPVTHLTDIYRQKNGSSIILNSLRINEGKFPICSNRYSHPDDNFFFFETAPGQGVNTLIQNVIYDIPANFGFDPVKGIQVLLPINIGKSGTDEINIALRDKLNPNDGTYTDYAVGSKTFRPGDKVMQLSNDYDMQVFNGDVGYIDSIEEKGINVYFPDTDRLIYYTRGQTYNLTLAYAITVHKAQGAEFDAVVILLDKNNSANAIRRQLYTAVTRAKKAVILIGSRASYQKALSNESYVKRNTKLPERLAEVFLSS